MRRLTILVLALAAIYGGYWFIGATAVERTANAQVAQMRVNGWTIDYDDLSTQGFPSRFDTTVTALDVKTPRGGLAWQTPFVQALSLSYKPNEVILALPDRQDVTVNGVPLSVTSEGLRASAAVAPNTDLNLTRFTAEVGNMAIEGATGTVLSLSEALVALRPTEAERSYDVFADIADLALPLPLRNMLDPAGNYPAILSQMTVDASVVTDRALDRHALAAMQLPLLDMIKLNGMTLAWGPLQLRGSGAITIDSAGVPSGEVKLEVQNWREMMQMAVNAGLIEQGVSRTLMSMGAILAGGSNSISLPVSFQNGMMLLGPVPAGPAPRFR
ncbi:DUF2125 domain-containing protein [Yoonia sp. MH D7]